jgi:hypothetical protein
MGSESDALQIDDVYIPRFYSLNKQKGESSHEIVSRILL